MSFGLEDNIFYFLLESARRHPDKAYVVDKGIVYSYSDILKKTWLIAPFINTAGLSERDRIIIYLDNSAEYIAAYFAVLGEGGIAVPVNKTINTSTLEYIIADTKPGLLITNAVLKRRLQAVPACKGLRIIDIDEVWHQQSPAYPTTAKCKPSHYDSQPALIIYTSGTTRMPKGVTLTHRNLAANTDSIIQYLGLTECDSLLAVISFSYSYGNSLLLTHTKAGGTIIIENQVSYPIKVIEALYESKTSGFSTVGSYINVLLRQPNLQSHHLQSLRYITCAGESTRIDDIVKLNALAPHVKLFIMYGQTEASARLSYLDPDLVMEKPGSIGKAIPGVTIRVVTEEGHDVAPGVTGEIIASGANIMAGYWNNEAETNSVIKAGWLYTGDLAMLDEDGFIYIRGRKDDLITHLGYRISPMEIEDALNSCENVLESAVIAVQTQEGTQIKAFVVQRAGEPSITKIKTQVRKKLPAYKVPHVVEFVNEIPRTSSGKIKRSALRSDQN